MIIKQTPNLILAFNRDKKFKKCIKNNYDNGFRNIYLSLDGPRNDSDKYKQKKIKIIFNKFASKSESNCKSNYFKSNLGVLDAKPTIPHIANIIYSKITNFLAKIIVL